MTGHSTSGTLICLVDNSVRLLNLLHYIVSTNKGHLRLLKEEERIKHGVDGIHAPGKQHQFVMLCGDPRREK